MLSARSGLCCCCWPRKRNRGPPERNLDSLIFSLFFVISEELSLLPLTHVPQQQWNKSLRYHFMNLIQPLCSSVLFFSYFCFTCYSSLVILWFLYLARQLLLLTEACAWPCFMAGIPYQICEANVFSPSSPYASLRIPGRSYNVRRKEYIRKWLPFIYVAT